MHRGMGGSSISPSPVALEPVFTPFSQGKEAQNTIPAARGGAGTASIVTMSPLVAVRIRPTKENKWTRDLAEQFLLSLSFPASFEIVSIGGKVACQMVTRRDTAAALNGRLSALYADAEVFETKDILASAHIGSAAVATCRLRHTHFFPLRTEFKSDPYGSLLGIFASLGASQFGCLQVIVVPAHSGWGNNIMTAARSAYDPSKSAFYDLPNLPRMAERKASKPLFAVSLRLGGSTARVVNQLEGFLRQFEGENGLVCLAEPYPASSLWDRTVHSSGMLLNAEELACLGHVPGLEGNGLNLETAMPGVAPPDNATRNSLVTLGESHHQGRETAVGISAEALARHVAVFGSTGTGKTTMLLRFAELVDKGYGLAFLDPHGDAAETFLSLIPERRVDDCIYFNPGDREFPPGLNILESSGERENQLLCSDLLVSFERLFQDSWGPRMEWILRQCINTLLSSEGNKNLRDINRLLFDEDYRNRVLQTVDDPDIMGFWRHNFPKLPRGSLEPIVNKVSKFVDNPLVRNIIAQPNLIDFQEIVRNNRVFIANLSKGILGEDTAFLLGSFILSKLQIATLSRGELPPSQRRLFTIIIDEFQNYASDDTNTASIRSFLSEARKFGVVLVMATQFLSQLHKDVTAAIFGNVGTIVAFRCGVLDSQLLQKEFGWFTAEDIMDLGTLKAVVRMERSNACFNLEVPRLAVPQRSCRDSIINLSRQRYCRPRKEVAQLIWKPEDTVDRKEEGKASGTEDELNSRQVAFLEMVQQRPGQSVTDLYRALGLSAYMGDRLKRELVGRGFLLEVVTNMGAGSRIAKFLVPLPRASEVLNQSDLPGRGSTTHKSIQALLRTMGEKKGYRVTVEAQLTESGKSVDVLWEKGGQKTGIEVAVMSKKENEVANIKRALENGLDKVVVVFIDQGHMDEVQALAAQTLQPGEMERAGFCILTDLRRFLKL